VVVAHALPVDVRTWLGEDVELLAPVSGALPPLELAAALSRADALICPLTVRVDEALLGAAPRLRIVANYAVGVDNVDLAATRARGVLVTNTPGVLTEATADLTWALILAVARRVAEGDALVRRGEWKGWAPDFHLGSDVNGRSLGLVGLGRIGQAVARRARGFDMHLFYASPRRAPGSVEEALGASHVPLDELLRRSDFVSVHCPLSPDTRHLIGARELSLMQPGAFLVNTARGACVDEDALAEALAAGRIAGAGLDVFADEPRVSTRLLAQRRAVLLPHVGSATVAVRSRMAELCARAVAAVLAGQVPDTLVHVAKDVSR
jgi:glyoxylate reductase